MARKLRVEYPGAVYLVMKRGDRREPIFRDDADRQRFVSTLGGEMDSRATGNGRAGLRKSSALSSAKDGRGMSCQYQELTRLSVRQDSGRSLRQDWLAAACAVPDAPNHFHMVVETPRGNLVAGMKWFLGTYCGRFNRRHKLFGHLFSGRYKALLIDSRNSLTNSCCLF